VGREQLIPSFAKEAEHVRNPRTNAPPPPPLSEDETSYMHSTPTGMQCQVLRSVAFWSAGVQQPEQSIYKATQHLIRNAKHFIYIENQYFISAIAAHTPKNRILEALYHRYDDIFLTTFIIITSLPNERLIHVSVCSL
jgi:phosphatidylserine/phosphatidylglycerophosphate/cardiolipin synthase-like enzyme